MPISRRSFVTDSALLGFLAALPPTADEKGAQSAPHSQEPTSGEQYWSNLYKDAEQRGAAKTLFGDELRDPRFAFYDDKNGLRWAEDNKPDDLPSFNEDAVVTLELGGFRAGTIDQPRLSSVRFAQMHLSCQQVKGEAFIGPLAWAALATVFADKAKKLPSVQDLNFSPTSPQSLLGAPQLNRVLLPEGAGHLSVNITTTPTTSTLDKILSVTAQVT